MISQKLRNRLEKVAGNAEAVCVQRVIMVVEDDVTEVEMEARQQRWMAGEDVEGFRQHYKGGRCEFIVIRLVSVKPRQDR